jgi:phosphatidylserine/phosphatidylglycerophosphate/cardiolipin synthase-like enzyme
MDDFSLGNVQSIGASGKVWMGHGAIDIADLLFDELDKATKSIQISSYSTGNISNEMTRFFKVLKDKLADPPMKINIIVNDDGKKTVTPFARKQIDKLQSYKPEQFFPQYFKSTKIRNTYKILHAKIIVIDKTTALVGSANISKGALDSNYEIMLKIVGDTPKILSKMLTTLSEEIKLGRA